jgi:hypothetical protein
MAKSGYIEIPGLGHLLVRRPPMSVRARRLLGRLAWLATWSAVRFTAHRAWRHRGHLAPWYAAVAVYLLAAIASTVAQGWLTVASLAALGAAPLWWWCGGWAWKVTRRRGLKPRSHRAWRVAGYLSAAGWAIVAARFGGPVLARPGWLLAPTLACWIAWMWHRRIRHDVVEIVEEVVAAVDDRLLRWARIAGAGKPLAGADLENLAEFDQPPRWEADIALPSGDLTVENVVRAHRRITSAYSTRRDNVILDEAPGGEEDRARLTVVLANPCHDRIEYDGSWQDGLTSDGCLPFHTYPDGFRGALRLWQPGSGTAHTLFSGDTRSGKSAGMETALLQAVTTGLVWPMVGDPQGGQSLPAWCRRDGGGYARSKAVDAEGVYVQLLALKEAMYARSDLLGRMVWEDEDGEHVGLSFYDPFLTGLPILLYVLDEAHVACKDPEWKHLIIPLIEEIVKMAGKTGIALWLATQYPGIEELGNKMAIRQNLVAGNVVCYRNSAKTSGTMVLPSHMPRPYEIPKETPDGEHTKGTAVIYSAAPRSSRATYSRSAWARRAHFFAEQASARIPELDVSTAAALAAHLPDLGAVREPAVPQRDTVTVTKGQPIRELALAFLRSRPSGRAHTGVIAAAIDKPLPSVVTALRRAEPKGLVHQARTGIWALGAKPEASEVQGTLDEAIGAIGEAVDAAVGEVAA